MYDPSDLSTPPRRTRVKICGITRACDAQAAVAAGVDALGFNFWPGGKRYVQPQAAAAIVAALPPFVTTVGLFVDADADTVRAVCEAVQIDIVQFHGNEGAQACASACAATNGGTGRPHFKAVRMREEVDLAAQVAEHHAARALLLDAYRPGVPGGTGVSFDWSRIPANLGKPVVLAGGLEAANVARAISSVQPFAVDVSGGVESAPGIKDPSKMIDFISEVRRADSF